MLSKFALHLNLTYSIIHLCKTGICFENAIYLQNQCKASMRLVSGINAIQKPLTLTLGVD